MTDPNPVPRPEAPLPGDPGGNPPPSLGRMTFGDEPKPRPGDDDYPLPGDAGLPGDPGPNPEPTRNA